MTGIAQRPQEIHVQATPHIFDFKPSMIPQGPCPYTLSVTTPESQHQQLMNCDLNSMWGVIDTLHSQPGNMGQSYHPPQAKNNLLHQSNLPMSFSQQPNPSPNYGTGVNQAQQNLIHDSGYGKPQGSNIQVSSTKPRSRSGSRSREDRQYR